MGSQQSSIFRASRSDKCPPLSSDFHKALKKRKDYRRFIRENNMEFNIYSVSHLWYMRYLSRIKFRSLLPYFRNHMKSDFINRLYSTSSSFDEIFVLLFKEQDRELRRLAEDFLKYASTTDLQFFQWNRQGSFENVVDYPLKTLGPCPCTRRPLYVAIYFWEPDVVRLLLNCGARIPYEDVCNCNLRNRSHPLGNVPDLIKGTIEIMSESNTLDKILDLKEKFAESLKVLLVDLSYISPLWTKVCRVLGELTSHEFEETIPSLKHMSRAQIRIILRNKRVLAQLESLEKLSLPKVIISYIYIEENINPDRE